MQWLETPDGLVNAAFVLTVSDTPQYAADGKTKWHVIEYLAGLEVRRTFIDAETFAKLSS